MALDSSDFTNALRKLATSGVDKIASTVLGVGGKVLLKETRRSISKRDHSLSQLREMGHPYSRRMGGKGIHGGAALVHTRSGRMIAALKGKMDGKRKYVYGFDESIAPHAKMVVMGTKVMVPRDVFRHVYDDKKKSKFVIKAMEGAFHSMIGKINGR